MLTSEVKNILVQFLELFSASLRLFAFIICDYKVSVSQSNKLYLVDFKDISILNCRRTTVDAAWMENCMLWYLCPTLHCGLFPGPNVTFVPNNNLMTWTEAQSYCREHHTDLATVRNMAENQKVSELVPSGQDIWIGLYRDPWKWSDGSTSSFRYWRPMEPNGPNELCVAADFSHSGRWEDWNCDQKRAFICYRQREW
uniref:C-type lectin domain-containing protein n=1 Tax=Dicentrarchus labrax TaxID=13489 RepID=A0A8P4G5L8_DICLA